MQYPVCPSCNQEVFRFVNGICHWCWRKKEAELVEYRSDRDKIMAKEARRLELRQFVKNFNRLVKGKG